MELEEMKELWTEMSEHRKKQERLTGKLIIMMTRQQYKNRLYKIAIPETTGSLMCVAIAVLIFINFKKYDTVFLAACGIISAAVLLLLAVLSLGSVYKMNHLNIGDNNYKQIITEYAKGKRRFLAAQKLNFYLGFVLVITILPVMVIIMGGGHVTIKPAVWFWYIPSAFIFFILFTALIYRYYVKATIQMEDLLKELEE